MAGSNPGIRGPAAARTWSCSSRDTWTRSHETMTACPVLPGRFRDSSASAVAVTGSRTRVLMRSWNWPDNCTGLSGVMLVVAQPTEKDPTWFVPIACSFACRHGDH